MVNVIQEIGIAMATIWYCIVWFPEILASAITIVFPDGKITARLIK